MPDAQIIRHEGAIAPPCKVKLMKMSKGYQWEISYSDESSDQVLYEIDKIDAQLKILYGGQA